MRQGPSFPFEFSGRPEPRPFPASPPVNFDKQALPKLGRSTQPLLFFLLKRQAQLHQFLGVKNCNPLDFNYVKMFRTIRVFFIKIFERKSLLARLSGRSQCRLQKRHVCSSTVCLVLGHAGRLARGGLHVFSGPSPDSPPACPTIFSRRCVQRSFDSLLRTAIA